MGVIVFWLSYVTFLLVRIKEKIKSTHNEKDSVNLKVGLVKFNPFNEVGSNQSFCMALLLNSKLGIILTSLHGRNGTRVYARQINLDNKKKEKLSEEEKDAIKQALQVEIRNEE